MREEKESLRRSSFRFGVLLGPAAVAIGSAAGAQAQAVPATGLKDGTPPAEVRVVSTEFQYSPSKVRVAAGRPATLVLDNGGAETEHGIFVPALGFRLQAKAGEIAQTTLRFDKPGEYDFMCDLPGHREAGMLGKLIVGDVAAKR